jgi:alpha/beta superfamily hydrolase
MSEPTPLAPRSGGTEISGPAGMLEAAVDSSVGPAVATAVVCHPHPLQQGAMSNKVVTTVARAFARLGADAVRFNFRGVGRSDGSYAEGVGEADDALAVVAWCRERWPERPLYLGGFSFGAAVALSIAARVAPSGLVTVAPPVDRVRQSFVAPRCPWLLVHGEADDVVPAAPVLEWSRALPLPPKIVLLPGVGHFFHGSLAALTQAVTETFGPELAARGRADAT